MPNGSGAHKIDAQAVGLVSGASRGGRGINRETVARYVHSPPADSKPTTNPSPGSEATTVPRPGKSPGPENQCGPFWAVTQGKLREGSQ
jgi:hypothetical protein